MKKAFLILVFVSLGCLLCGEAIATWVKLKEAADLPYVPNMYTDIMYDFSSAMYDPIQNCVYMGYADIQTNVKGLWKYDLNTNQFTEYQITNFPTDDCTMASLDLVNNRIIMMDCHDQTIYAVSTSGGVLTSLGGGDIYPWEMFGRNNFQNPYTNNPVIMNGYGWFMVRNPVMEYDIASSTWITRYPDRDDQPWRRAGASITTNAGKTKVYMFGGFAKQSGSQFGSQDPGFLPWASDIGYWNWQRDLWELDLSTWQWTNLLGPNEISITSEGSICYNDDTNTVVMIGGYVPAAVWNNTPEYIGGVHQIRLGVDSGLLQIQETGQIPPVPSTANYSEGAAIYDAVNNRVIYFRYDGIWALTITEIPSLTVTSTPTGAGILIDGIDSGFDTPHTFDDPNSGVYSLSPSYFNWVPQSVNIGTLTEDTTINFVADPLFLNVSSYPPGQLIYRNGESTGQVTPFIFDSYDVEDLTGIYTLPSVPDAYWIPTEWNVTADMFVNNTATIEFDFSGDVWAFSINVTASDGGSYTFTSPAGTFTTPTVLTYQSIDGSNGLLGWYEVIDEAPADSCYCSYWANQMIWVTQDMFILDESNLSYNANIEFVICNEMPWYYVNVLSNPEGYLVYQNGTPWGLTNVFQENWNWVLPSTFTISEPPVGYRWEPTQYTIGFDTIWDQVSCGTYAFTMNFMLVPNFTLTITSNPPGPDILIDGLDSGFDTPYTFANPVPGVYSMSPPYFNWVPQSVTIGTLTEDTTINFVADPLFLNVTSSPPGQAIYRNGLTTGHVTPYVFSSFSTQDLAGTYTLLAVPGAFWVPEEWVVTVDNLLSGRARGELGTASTGRPEYDYSIDFVLDYYTLTVTSDPSGASIWRDGSDTGQITPHTFDPCVPGTYSVQLAGWSFTPNTHSVPVLGEDFAINFLGLPPLAPSTLAATTISSSQINLAWTDNSANETGFKIERKTATGTWQQIATVGANVNAYNNTGLEQHTVYYYQVRAYHQLGDSGYSNEASATTLYATPNAPTNLTAAPVSSVGINLAWTDNSTLETGFKIERKTGVSGSWSQIGTVGANVTTYSSTGLTQHTTYYYRVRAYNVDVNSAYSNEANATTFYATPAAPTNLTAVSPNCQQINISWTDNADNETAYYVERKIGETGSWTTIATLFANFTFYNNNFLAQHTTYYYRVRALNVEVYSDYSNEASATTSYCTPAAPTNLTAQAISSSQINLSWTENSAHETDIIIERKATAGGVWSEIAVLDSNSTSYSDTGLPHGITYYYRVRALNVEVYSPYSNEASATPVEPPTADFGSDVTVVLALDEVQFSDMSVPGSGALVQWLWDFGDGNTSSLQNPAHAYQNAGTYTISLTVTNSFDSTAVVTRPNYIQVLPRTPQIALVPATALDFGIAYLGSQSTRELLIQNTGSATLNINSHSFKLPNSRFSLIWPTLPAQIPEGASLAIQLQFTPQVTGPVTDSLFIYNNSVNLPLAAIGLTGNSAIAAPRAPDNVSIAMNGNDAVITWSVVAQTIHDTPVTPDYYFVYNADDPYGAFTLLGLSSSLSYTHSYVGLGARCKFYRISAVKFYRDDLAEGDLDTWLKRNLVPGMSDDAVRKAIRDINRE